MQDTRETTPTAWSDHDGYDLTRYTLSPPPSTAATATTQGWCARR